jgi:hypothetical protein
MTKTRLYFAIWVLFLLPLAAFAQSKTAILAVFTQQKPSIAALRVEKPPIIDGKLDDAAWQNAPVASHFTQEEPQLGQPARQPTEVRIVYDDDAIYIAARMTEVSRDSILRELRVRDGDSNSDWVSFNFDTYEDGQNGFGFLLTPTNVQGDYKFISGNTDGSWNAVWTSATSINNDGWVAELRIPYSAIRFAAKPEQHWKLQIGRERRFCRETSWWSPFDPNGSGFMTQAGNLTDIRGIKPPLRLSFLPYISSSVEHYPYNEAGKSNYTPNFRAGMDLKYGINDAFTLDMTTVPDFGQVRSDNRILNLSPFEVQYDEQRPFFNEGVELFSKADLLYSRRIGQTPSGYYDVENKLHSNEHLVNNPGEGQLLNSAKISGRTGGGLGIGLLNSVTNAIYAEAEDDSGNRRRLQTDPLTNYNVLVFDQNLKYNSSVTFTNTNVLRNGADYDANVTALTFRLNNKKNSYSVYGGGKLSQIYNTGLLNPELGKRFGIGISRTSGQLQWSAKYTEMDTKFNPNDLGYSPYNNERSFGGNVSYNEFKPKQKWLQRYGISGSTTYSRLYSPNSFANFGVGLDGWLNTKKFNAFGAFAYAEPITTYDFYEPRVTGRFQAYPRNGNIGGWISTDYRKKFALDVNGNFRFFKDHETSYSRSNFKTSRYRANISISPRYRVNNQLSFFLDIGSYNFLNDIGYATRRNNDADIIFSRRDVITLENTLTAKYIFNNRMGLSLRARHYWSTAAVKKYYRLTADGELASANRIPNFDATNLTKYNRSFNAFNVDMVYSWVFAPGSEVSVVWKNAIYQSDDAVYLDYITDVRKTFTASQTNNVSIKVLYYLDYLTIRNKLKRG